MIAYRPYQILLIQQILESIRSGHRKPLLVLPMSGGKSVIMGGLINALTVEYGFKSHLVVAPFVALKEQLQKTLTEMDIHATCTTYHSALSHLTNESRINTLLFDEAHHVMGTEWRAIPEQIDFDVLCGFTATPYRADDCPLLEQNGGVFDDLIVGPDIESLTNQGYLADYDYYSYPLLKRIKRTPIIMLSEIITYLEDEYFVVDNKTEDIIEEYTANFNEMSGIVFCRSVEHASIVTDQFNGVGIKAASVNCYKPRKDTKQILTDFKDSKITILTACNMASEGLDIPHAKLGILARPIVMSLALFLQQCGRFLRPYNNEKAKILDLCGNVYKFGDPKEAYRRAIV